jgi:hypothetical protein
MLLVGKDFEAGGWTEHLPVHLTDCFENTFWRRYIYIYLYMQTSGEYWSRSQVVRKCSIIKSPQQAHRSAEV